MWILTFIFSRLRLFIGDPDVENRQERTRTYTELKREGARDGEIHWRQVGWEIPPSSRHLLDDSGKGEGQTSASGRHR